MGFISKDMNSVIDGVTKEAKDELSKELEKRIRSEFEKMLPTVLQTCLSRLTFATNLVLAENSAIPEFRVVIDFKKESKGV